MTKLNAGYPLAPGAAVGLAKEFDELEHRPVREPLRFDIINMTADIPQPLSSHRDYFNPVEPFYFLALLESHRLADTHHLIAGFEEAPAKPPRHGLGPVAELF